MDIRKELKRFGDVSLESLPLVALDLSMVPIPGRDFSMCKYPVTQGLWELIMGENPSKSKGVFRPVVSVSWDDCQKFLKKLNARPEIIASGRQYRLPTADEWEFACRAGAPGDYCQLADGTEVTEKTLGEVAWFEDNSGGSTHAVGQKKPNAYGLYDMLGNVWEWTSTDKDGKRVECGSAENASAGSCRAGKRRSVDPPDKKFKNLGLRLASVSLSNAERKAAAARVEAERTKVEAERKAAAVRAEAATIAELASNMVAIPGKNYSICKYQVTQALWKVVMGGDPSNFKGENLPVGNVSWNDCQKFLKKLNARPEVKKSGRTYRLPTEDEWKYACRAGATGDYCKLADGMEITEKTLGEVAWFRDNSNGKRHPVGQKKPNAFGLYDMHGNVEEWTSTPKIDYPERRTPRRVICGGCFNYNADGCKSNHRISFDPDKNYWQYGFRLAADK